MNTDILKSVEMIHDIFKRKKLTLSVAESCTGGLISHYITTIPGASHFFIGGVISYTSESKEQVLGVSRDRIRKYGVISKETACEMADRVRLLFKTDYSISSTGNLGPDVLEGKAKGLVHIASSKDGMTISKNIMLTYDRERNKEEAALRALNLLIEIMEKGTGNGK